MRKIPIGTKVEITAKNSPHFGFRGIVVENRYAYVVEYVVNGLYRVRVALPARAFRRL